MNLKLVLILSVLISSSAFGQKEIYFLPFIDSTSGEKLCGYKNQSGDILIPAKYPAIFYSDTLWQYNHMGTATHDILAFKQKDSISFQPFICDKEMQYSKGKMSRIEKNGKMGFVNDKSEVVIPAKYDFVTQFKDGFAEFYQGVEKVYLQGNWYWGGNIQQKGYLNEEGREFSEKTVKWFANGNMESVSYSWTGIYSCLGGNETFAFYENGNLKSHFIYEVLPNCKPDHESRYILNESGDTVHREIKKREQLNGEYRLGHYDYYYDSTGKNRINEWFVIRSSWSNGNVLDFMNDDLLFLNENYRRISKNKIIKKINNGRLKWTYTYLPQEVWLDTGTQIKFIIHPDARTHQDQVSLKKAKEKVLKHWVSREFNRLIYHSDSITITAVDSAGTGIESNAEIGISKRDHARLVKLLDAESEYAAAMINQTEANIKITSYNGNKRKTILWVSVDAENIYIERDIGQFIKLKHSDKLNKKVRKLLIKYKVMLG